jgi:hypothetical protein
LILLSNYGSPILGQIGRNLDSSPGYRICPQPYHQVIHRPCGAPADQIHSQAFCFGTSIAP